MFFFFFGQAEGLIRLFKVLIVLVLGEEGHACFSGLVEEESSYQARNGFGESAEVTQAR